MITILEASDFSPDFNDSENIERFMYAACGWPDDIEPNYAGEIRIRGVGGTVSLHVGTEIEAMKSASLVGEVPTAPYYIVQDSPTSFLCMIPEWSVSAVRKAMMAWARWMGYRGILVSEVDIRREAA